MFYSSCSKERYPVFTRINKAMITEATIPRIINIQGIPPVGSGDSSVSSPVIANVDRPGVVTSK